MDRSPDGVAVYGGAGKDERIRTRCRLRRRQRRGYNMVTASGQPFWPASPQAKDIRIYDIAWQLARTCRFAGALREGVEIYSVAQHSCLVSDHCPPEFKLEGLLHDAHEYVFGDVIRPVKASLPGERPAEVALDRLIRAKYGLPVSLSPEVKEQDFRAVVTERRDLLPPHPDVDWGELPEPWPERIEPWLPSEAAREFIKRFTS